MRQVFDDDLIIAIPAIVRRIMVFDHRSRIRRCRIENDDGARWAPVAAIDAKTAGVKSGILYDRDETAGERYGCGAF